MIRKCYLILSLCLSVAAESAALPVNQDVMAKEILLYINQFRTHKGLPQLQMNTILTQEARQHSADMAVHRVGFGHDGFTKRIAHLRQHIKTAQGGAENVAYNYKSARIVAEGWIKSPGHRRNILGHYDQTGIGIVWDKRGRPYYTQLFLKT